MRPRFVGRIGLADVITLANAVVGLLAAVVALDDPRLAARLVLLAAVGDGLDGVVARTFGGTPVGEYLDSLSDVAAFGVAPAVLVVGIVRAEWGVSVTTPSAPLAVTLVVVALFLAMVVLRLGLYTAYDAATDHTHGVPSTLAATILGAAVLAGIATPEAVLVGTAVLTYLMVAEINYPDLLARDALLMGVVHVIAVVAPDAFGRAFPYALLTLAVAYLVLGPILYWRGGDVSHLVGR
jgi:CDP-diacylglycerol--serine O-phosphatidyltransferase